MAGGTASRGTRPSVFQRLYTGTGAFDIVGRRMTWYAVFGIIVAICLGSILFRGFHLGIDFEGGTQIQFPAAATAVPADVESVKQVVEAAAGEEPSSVQTAGTGAAQTVQIRTETLTPAQLVAVKQALYDTFQPVGADGVPSPSVISDSDVSGTWGGQITRQAMIALAVFLVLVTIFLGFYFERAMAIAALIALVHDVVVTAGIYSIVGFEVTPATVIGLLTILGFSLYDTVVVFDKVTENTRGILGLTRRTYAEAANLALNQTLMRSINTSLIAVLPVIGLLVIGVGVLGVGTLAHPRGRGVVDPARDPAARRSQAARQALPGPGRPGPRAPGEDRRRSRRRRRRGGAGSRGRRRPGHRAAPREGAVRGGRHAGPAHAPPPGRTARGEAHRQGGATHGQAAPVSEPDPLERVLGLIREVPDFPSPGILFRDITPVLADAEALTTVATELAALMGDADLVAGIEARGFLLGTAAALVGGTGVVPVRKAGKLPRVAASRSYDLEYGTATLELPEGVVEPGARVLVVDDVLATGGTGAATVDLLGAAGADVVAFAVLAELTALGGRARLAPLPVHALLAF
jgi:preprotein translocase subunit SecF